MLHPVIKVESAEYFFSNDIDFFQMTFENVKQKVNDLFASISSTFLNNTGARSSFSIMPTIQILLTGSAHARNESLFQVGGI